MTALMISSLRRSFQYVMSLSGVTCRRTTPVPPKHKPNALVSRTGHTAQPAFLARFRREPTPEGMASQPIGLLRERSQSARQIAFEIGGLFQADRQTDETIADAVVGSFGSGHEFVRRSCGIRHRGASVRQRR